MIRHRLIKILSGQTDSLEIYLGGDLLVGVFLPAAVTGTIKVEAKNETNGGWYTFHTITFAASTYYPISPSDSLGVKTVRLVSSQAEGADRTFAVSLVEV